MGFFTYHGSLTYSGLLVLADSRLCHGLIPVDGSLMTYGLLNQIGSLSLLDFLL